MPKLPRRDPVFEQSRFADATATADSKERAIALLAEPSEILVERSQVGSATDEPHSKSP
jgi:hypothetical protein